MKMRSRSQLDLAKTWFWIVLVFVVISLSGFLKIALIVAMSVGLLLWLMGTITGGTTPKQKFKINPFYPPPAWKEVHDLVWDMFMTGSNDKDDVVIRRFLLHINAIADEHQPLFQQADRALYSKMTYEHLRRYGSLEYTYDDGLHVITGPETLRQLSNEEREPFVAFCQEQFTAYIQSYEIPAKGTPSTNK